VAKVELEKKKKLPGKKVGPRRANKGKSYTVNNRKITRHLQEETQEPVNEQRGGERGTKQRDKK